MGSLNHQPIGPFVRFVYLIATDRHRIEHRTSIVIPNTHLRAFIKQNVLRKQNVNNSNVPSMNGVLADVIVWQWLVVRVADILACESDCRKEKYAANDNIGTQHSTAHMYTHNRIQTNTIQFVESEPKKIWIKIRKIVS